MDLELVSELRHVMGMDGSTGSSPTGTARLLRYITTLPSVPTEHIPLLLKFVQHAFEVLPSSNLPMLAAQKFNLSAGRKRKVSFGKVEICSLNDGSSNFSLEGEKQRVRESKSLAIANTDPHKKFRPRDCAKKGMPFQTRNIPIFDASVLNCWPGPLRKSGMAILTTDYKVDDVIANPSLLDKYR